jgi:hypothetical protein
MYSLYIYGKYCKLPIRISESIMGRNMRDFEVWKKKNKERDIENIL